MKTICFTGFNKESKKELIDIANKKGFNVTNDVVKNLNYLCCGSNAGPSKIKKAKSNGAIILSEDDFKSSDSDYLSTQAYTQESPLQEQESQAESIPVNSIHDAHPLLDFLWSGIDKNEIITIIYHGGSQSGVSRDIVPRALNEKFMLTAVDLSSPGRNVKNYSIDKIEVTGIQRICLSAQVRDSKNTQNQPEALDFHNIADVYVSLKDTLKGMGWHVTTYQNNGNCIRIDVCDYFKNGKPRKTPVVTLYFEPENNTRPYVCKCREAGFVNTYSRLDKAAVKFIELAYEASLLAEDEA